MTVSRVIPCVLLASLCLVPSVGRAQGMPGQSFYQSPWNDPSGYGGGGYPPPMTSQGPPRMQLAPVYNDTPRPQKGRYGHAAYESPYGQRPPIEQQSYTKDYPPARMGQRLFGRDGNREGIAPTEPHIPHHMGTPYTAVPGQGYYGPDGIITKHAPDEDSWDEAGPLELMLTQAFRRTWFRTEYLLWDIQNPTKERLGAPLANNVDLNNFTVLDPVFFPQQLGFAHVPTTDRLTLDDTNGVKLTFGIPFGPGELELSGFLLENQGDKDTMPYLPSPAAPFAQFAATTTFTNGQLGSNVLVYDESFVMDYESEVWGADFKYVFDTMRPGEGIKLRPLVGARFINVREHLIQTGVYNNFRTLPDLVSVIDSEANNHVFGGIVGARLEFVHRWFTVGIEPRAGGGINRYLARVETKNLRSVGDGIVRTEEKDTIFSPVIEGTCFARVHVSENISLSVGYNWLGLYNITRPAENIYYNDNGPLPTPPGVVVNAKTSEMWVRGLMVGGEVRFGGRKVVP